MVVASVDIADVITVCAREDSKVNVAYELGMRSEESYELGIRNEELGMMEVSGSGAAKQLSTSAIPNSSLLIPNCSVTKAVNALRGRFGNFGADIRVEKNIPFSAGLGGSSADAAGVIKALEQLYGFDIQNKEAGKLGIRSEKLGMMNGKKNEDSSHNPSAIPHSSLLTPHSIGSDVPYMLRGGFCRVRGVGERLDFFDAPLTFWVVIAKGSGGVLSADAYRKFDELTTCRGDGLIDKFFTRRRDTHEAQCMTGQVVDESVPPTSCLIAALKKRDKAAAYRLMENALTPASISLNPEIEKTLAALSEAGADKAIMTGSGSACVGFFAGEAAAKAAAQRLAALGLYARAVKTLQKGIETL